MGFTIFALIFLAIGLAHDYNKDKGTNIKAKVCHGICLAVLISSYAGSMKIIGMLIRDFDGARKRFSIPFGPISGEAQWLIYLGHSAVVITVVILAYQMIRRSDKSRVWLLRILPVAALFEVFSFCRSWILGSVDIGVEDGIIILFALIFIAGTTAAIIFIYSSKFMRDFFAFVPTATSKVSEPVSEETKREVPD